MIELTEFTSWTTFWGCFLASTLSNSFPTLSPLITLSSPFLTCQKHTVIMISFYFLFCNFNIVGMRIKQMKTMQREWLPLDKYDKKLMATGKSIWVSELTLTFLKCIWHWDFFICSIKSPQCADKLVNFFFDSDFLPRVLMCQKHQISLPVGYKTARPKTRDWERLWRQFRAPSFAKNIFLRRFLIFS